MKKILLFVIILSFCSGIMLSQNSISYIKKGSGKPIIFLPAMGCKGSVWDNTVNELSKNYCCYEVSICGFGGIPLKSDFSFERIVKDLTKIIITEKLKQPILIGHSVSGFIALKAASENPKLFSKLIIVDSFPFALASIYPSITEKQAKQQAVLVKDMMLKESNDKFKASQNENLKNLISNKTNIDTVINWIMQSNRNAIAEATSLMISTDLRNAIKKIDCKTLIIGTWKGKEQFGYTKSSAKAKFEEQYKNIKDKRIIISDSAKHFIMLDEPKWLNTQIKGFISE